MVGACCHIHACIACCVLRCNAAAPDSNKYVQQCRCLHQVLWQHCNFTNNKATEAGAVFAVGRSNHTLALCLLTDNNATIGGAIRAAQQSQVALISTLLQHNSAPQQTRGDGGYGGGISIEEDSQVCSSTALTF